MAEYGKYIVTELKIPEEKQKIAAEYSKYATRILWMDDNVVEGAFHMNTAWYLKSATTLEDTSHTHDTDEIIGFFVNAGLRGRIGASHDDLPAAPMNAVDKPQYLGLLRQHAADEHYVGPIDLGIIQGAGIHIDELLLPTAGEKGGQGNQTERGGRIPGTH